MDSTMDCPVASICVGEQCLNKRCWFWHVNAKGNCVADDVGNTHVLAVDVARIYNESIEATNARIARGRNKMAAWLALLNTLEDYKEEGCEVCGAPKCGKGEKCYRRRKVIHKLKKQLPFEEVIEMNPSRWYNVLKIKASGNIVFSIDLDYQ